MGEFRFGKGDVIFFGGCGWRILGVESRPLFFGEFSLSFFLFFFLLGEFC